MKTRVTLHLVVESEEQGSVMVLFLALVLGLLVGAGLIGSLATAASSRALAQGVADGAALEAAGELRNGLYSGLIDSGTDQLLQLHDAAAEAAASRYAAENGARLTAYARNEWRVTVTVEALRSGETVARADAAAELVVNASAISYAGRAHSDGPAGLGSIRPRSDSALFAYGSDCGMGIDVAHLTPAMKTSIVAIEDAMGRGLELTSAFRTYECQARLFHTVAGPVALPGRSLHNAGMAIDVAQPAAVAPFAARANLCQPFPQTDPEHFSLSPGPECGGHRGSLDEGQAFAAGLDSYLDIDVRLIPSE